MMKGAPGNRAPLLFERTVYAF